MNKRIVPILAALVVLAPCLLHAKEKPDYDTRPVVPVELSDVKCAAKLLVDRGEIYPDVLKMLESAKEEILLNMYLFGGFDNFTQGDDYIGIGKAVVDVMARKMAQGVRVRIITPKPSGMIKRQTYIKAKVAVFKRKMRKFLRLPEPQPPSEPAYAPVFYYAREKGLPCLASNVKVLGGGCIWKLDHSKLLIIDGKEALIGGMNFAETVASNRDAMTRLAGPVVRQLKAVFANAWNYSLQQADFTGDRVKDEWRDAAGLADCDDARIAQHFKLRRDEGWPTCDLRVTLSAPYINDTRARVVELIDSTSQGDKISVEMLLMTDHPCIDALIRAHKRGVDVRVLLDPNESLYGVNCMGAPNIIAVRDFIEADLPVRSFEPEPGQELHMKMMLVERSSGEAEFAMGSTNWTVGAFDSNYELFAFYRNCKALTDRLSREFDHDWNERSQPAGHPVKVGEVSVVRGEEAKQQHLTLLQKMIEAFVDSFDQKIF